MRTLTLKAGDAFGENELDPPRWLVADVWDGAVTLVQRMHPDETMGDLRDAAVGIVDARRSVNGRNVDSRRRKSV